MPIRRPALRGPATVRGRTTVLAATVVGVALVLAGIGLVLALRTRVHDAARSTAELRAADLASLTGTDLPPGAFSFAGREQGSIQLVRTADRQVVAASRDLDGEPPIARLQPPVGRSVSREVELPDRGRVVLVARGADSPTGPVTIYTTASLVEADETVRDAVIALALTIPLLVAVVALTTRYIVGLALRPVDRLRDEVAGLTDRDLHQRVAVADTGDEIQRLAGTMNQLLARLERSSDVQRRFVADASHELRSPLASARAALEVAIAHPRTTDPVVALTDALVDQDRLERLVDDLLALARATERTLGRGSSAVDLAVVVADEVAAADDPRIVVDAAVGGTTVDGDRRILARIVRNLVDNARHHAATRVTVSLESVVAGRQRTVLLAVDDDGPGVDPADRVRIFDRFTRLDEARTSGAGGSGLGLAIVSEGVRGHAGTVAVHDSALGGARFEVRLAALAVSPPSAVAGSARPAEVSPGAG